MATIGELTAQLGMDIKDFAKKVKEVEAMLKELENETEKTNKKAGESFDHVLKGVRSTIAAYISYKTIKKSFSVAKEIALEASRYTTLGVVLNAVGKNAAYTQDELSKTTEVLQKMGISALKSREATIKMIQAHIDLREGLKLARIAQDAAVIGNINSSEAFDRVVYGLQTAQIEVLKSIGINVNFEQSYAKLAKQLGKTVNNLTEQEKLQARLNTVYERGADIVGTYENAMSTAGKKITSFSRYTEDFRVKMGKAFEPATIILVDKATEAMKKFTEELTNPNAQQGLEDFALGVASIGNAVISLAEGLSTLTKYAGLRSTFTTFFEGIDLASKGFLDFDKVKAAGALELQKMVDEVRASQTKQVEDYIDTLYQSTGVVKDYVEVEEQAGVETRKRIQDEKLRTEGLIQLKAAQENVIDFMKKLKTTTSLDKEILQINQYFDKLEKGISGGFNLKKEREEALAYIKEYSKNIGILELKLKQVTKVVDTGFDPYGDLDEGKRTGGRELIKYLYEEAEAEFAEFLGDSTAKVISTAIMQGTEDAKQVAADLLAQSISSTLQKSISESIQSSISGSTGAFFGGLGGGIVAGLVGASISKLAGGSDASDERTEVIKQQTEEIKRNTAAIQRNIDFLNNQFSTYSAAFNNASEELISVSQTFVRFTAGGGTAGDLDAVGITNQAIENLKKQRKTTEAILETWGKVFDGIAKQARANIEKIDAEIDKLEKSTEQFRTIINNIQLDIIKSSTEMAERAGDAFLSASQIQTREFQKAAKNLIVAFTESLTLEGTLPDWNVDFLKNFAPDQWEGMIALLKKVTENTDAYNDVLKLEANLIQTVTSLAKAQSIAIRDSMVNSLGSLTSIFDDLDFKLSGVSRQSWVEERIQDFEKIYKEVGKLTEKEFDTAISYISEWYNTVIQNEQQAANMWKEVADTVRSLSDDIESTIRSIQLGSLNVSLGTVKTKFAGEEYTRLLQAAKSGDQQAISEFIAFSSQYLQVAQDTYKSSESYRDIYEQVMRDLNELNTFVQTDDYAKLLYDTNMDLLNETIISNSILLSIREKMDNFSSTFAGFISSSTTVQPSPGSSLPPVSSGLNELLVQEAVDTARSTGVFRYGNLVENARDRYGADVAMDVMNSLADMDLGEVGRAIYDADAYKRLFGFLPAYANEGIALTPQIATLAEQGPEVVLDKSRFDDMVKNDSPTNLYIYLGNELIDKRVIQIQQNNTVKLGRRGSNPGRTF